MLTQTSLCDTTRLLTCLKRCVQASRPCLEKDADALSSACSKSDSIVGFDRDDPPSNTEQINQTSVDLTGGSPSQVGELTHPIDDVDINVLAQDQSLWGYPAFFEPIMSAEDPSALLAAGFEVPADLARYLQDADTSSNPLNPLDFNLDFDANLFASPQAPGDTCRTNDTPGLVVIDVITRRGADDPGGTPW